MTVLVLVTVAGTVPVDVAVAVAVWVAVTVSVMVGGIPASATMVLTPPSGESCAFIRAARPSREPLPGSSGGTLDSQPAADARKANTTSKRGSAWYGHDHCPSIVDVRDPKKSTPFVFLLRFQISRSKLFTSFGMRFVVCGWRTWIVRQEKSHMGDVVLKTAATDTILGDVETTYSRAGARGGEVGGAR